MNTIKFVNMNLILLISKHSIHLIKFPKFLIRINYSVTNFSSKLQGAAKLILLHIYNYLKEPIYKLIF